MICFLQTLFRCFVKMSYNKHCFPFFPKMCYAEGTARVSSGGGEPYIGQIFAFSTADYTRVLLHTRPIAPPPLPPRATPSGYAYLVLPIEERFSNTLRYIHCTMPAWRCTKGRRITFVIFVSIADQTRSYGHFAL